MSSVYERLEYIEKLRSERLEGLSFADVAKVHEQGKLTARERIDLLLDRGTFEEVDFWSDSYQYYEFDDEIRVPGDALVGGWGEINGRPVCVWAQDASLFDGSMAEVHIAKIVRIMEKAMNNRVPIIGIYDSEGYRLQSAMMAKSYCSYGTMMRFQTMCSGLIPQIALVMGPCVGGAALSAPLADFVIMTKGTSFLHLNPVPQDISREEFGGARMHATHSGTCSVLAKDDTDCINKCKQLLSFFPQNCHQTTPLVPTQDDPDRTVDEVMEIIPALSTKSYDMRKIVKLLVDDGIYYEIQADYAPNLTVGFGRFNGQTAGIIANNPRHLGGVEDNKSSDKHARFTRFCDAMNIPLVYLADCPGFMPSIAQEHGGILRHGCQVIYATSEATVSKISIVCRKLYGGAQLAMPGNYCKPDSMWAWPNSERGLMGTDALVSIMFKGKMDRAKTPEEKAKILEDATKVMSEKVEYQGRVANEEMIDPRNTRKLIIKALKSQQNKQTYWPARKHDNTQL